MTDLLVNLETTGHANSTVPYSWEPAGSGCSQGSRNPRVRHLGGEEVSRSGAGWTELPGAGLAAQGGWEVGGAFLVPTEQVGLGAPEAAQAALPAWGGGVCSGPGRSDWLPSVFLVSVTRGHWGLSTLPFCPIFQLGFQVWGARWVGELPQGVNSCRPLQLFLL